MASVESQILRPTFVSPPTDKKGFRRLATCLNISQRLHASIHSNFVFVNDLLAVHSFILVFCPRTPTKFLIAILSTNKADGIDQIASIRLWIKCSMLSVTANDDIQRLTTVIVKLTSFRYMCNIDEAEILTAKEPLSAFFAGIGKTYEQAAVSESLPVDVFLLLQALK